MVLKRAGVATTAGLGFYMKERNDRLSREAARIARERQTFQPQMRTNPNARHILAQLDKDEANLQKVRAEMQEVQTAWDEQQRMGQGETFEDRWRYQKQAEANAAAEQAERKAAIARQVEIDKANRPELYTSVPGTAIDDSDDGGGGGFVGAFDEQALRDRMNTARPGQEVESQFVDRDDDRYFEQEQDLRRAAAARQRAQHDAAQEDRYNVGERRAHEMSLTRESDRYGQDLGVRDTGVKPVPGIPVPTARATPVDDPRRNQSYVGGGGLLSTAGAGYNLLNLIRGTTGQEQSVPEGMSDADRDRLAAMQRALSGPGITDVGRENIANEIRKLMANYGPLPAGTTQSQPTGSDRMSAADKESIAAMQRAIAATTDPNAIRNITNEMNIILSRYGMSKIVSPMGETPSDTTSTEVADTTPTWIPPVSTEPTEPTDPVIPPVPTTPQGTGNNPYNDPNLPDALPGETRQEYAARLAKLRGPYGGEGRFGQAPIVPSRPGVTDTQAGLPEGAEANKLANLEARYRQDLGLETPGELYNELLTYYTGIVNATIPDDQRDKDGNIKPGYLNNPEYKQRMLKAEEDALREAKRIRHGAEIAEPETPGLRFDRFAKRGPKPVAPSRDDYDMQEQSDRNEFSAAQKKYQTDLAAWESDTRTEQVHSVGHDAATIRSNLNNLPPDDDRREALTEMLQMYERFESEIKMADNAAEARESLERLRQEFEVKERGLREQFAMEERLAGQAFAGEAEEKRLEREDVFETWKRGQEDKAREFEEELKQAQLTGYWGDETGPELLARTNQRFQQEQARLQLGIQQSQAATEFQRAERMKEIEKQRTEEQKDTLEIQRQRFTDEQRRLDAQLTGYLGPGQTEATLDMEEFGWTKTLQKAEMTGVFDGQDTIAFKSLKFQRDLDNKREDTKVKLRELDLEIAESNNASRERIADKEKALGENKLADAVEARRQQFFLDQRKMDLEKQKTQLSTIQAISSPTTLMVFQRTGMMPVLERILGVSLDFPEFPDMLPEGVTVPTQQYLNFASPIDRQLIMTEASLRSGMSDVDVRSVLQRQMPGGLGVSIGYRGEGR